jgi:hypothetical protein
MRGGIAARRLGADAKPVALGDLELQAARRRVGRQARATAHEGGGRPPPAAPPAAPLFAGARPRRWRQIDDVQPRAVLACQRRRAVQRRMAVGARVGHRQDRVERVHQLTLLTHG